MQYEESDEHPSISLSASRPVGHPRPWQPVQDIPPARPGGLFLVSLREVGSKARRWLRVREPEGWANARGEPGCRESRARTCLGIPRGFSASPRPPRATNAELDASKVIREPERRRGSSSRSHAAIFERSVIPARRAFRNLSTEIVREAFFFDSQPAEACARTTVLAHPPHRTKQRVVHGLPSVGLAAVASWVWRRAREAKVSGSCLRSSTSRACAASSMRAGRLPSPQS